MFDAMEVTQVWGREILDSRGNPTVEAEVTVRRRGREATGRVQVPSGASTGSHEAVELRDGHDHRFHGAGVGKAVEHVRRELAEALIGRPFFGPWELDRMLLMTDGSENKGRLGANAILSVSMAAARAAAKLCRLPLYRYLGGAFANRMPVPMMNILNGGRHADNTVDLQEFMIMPVGAPCYKEGLRMCAEIYHTLKEMLKDRGLSTAVGDEGGFAPDLRDAGQVLSLLSEAVEKAGYRLEEDIVFAVDAAASELYDAAADCYRFPGESRMTGEEVSRTAEEMICYYQGLCSQYPIRSIEDGLYEDDWEGWRQLTRKLGSTVSGCREPEVLASGIQLVGDDLFVTNPQRLKTGIEKRAANAILVKVNQIGTLSEAFAAIDLAHRSGYRSILSHRSGETEDAILADLAVAAGSGQIKTGAPCRSDRTAKYNALLRIEEQLGGAAVYENPLC